MGGQQHRRGFSLTEVLVAMGLFTVGMVGIIALFGAAGMTARQAIDTTDAAVLLDSVMEDIDAHFLVRYRPENYPTEIEGYPEALIAANNGSIPDSPGSIAIPPGWPGYSDVQALTGRGSLAEPMTYVVYFEPLPNTADPVTGRPQCVLARVIVFWTRNARSNSLRGEKIILLPN